MPEPVNTDHQGAVVLAVTFTAQDLEEVRRRVRDASAAWGLDSEELTDWVMAINELTTNAVRHGSDAAHLVLKADSMLSCQVRDQGPGFDASRFLGRSSRPTLTEHGGIGLWLVERTTRVLALTSGPQGTSVSVAARGERQLKPRL
jgi:serine/threonine-protein kinase RsbW